MEITHKGNTLKIIRGIYNFNSVNEDTALTIGSFDGVHLGHQMVLNDLKAAALKRGLKSAVMIFEPQPQEYFSGEKAPARLMRLRDKLKTFCDSGIDIVVCLRFDDSLRNLTADAFISIIINGLYAKHLIIGDDFRFGCDRSGDFKMLQNSGKLNNFTVQQMRTFDVDDKRVSSTSIRKALIESKFDLAAKLLGKPFEVVGKVTYGAQVGRKLGFPTANINLKRYRVPITGVFAVTLRIDKKVYNGAANVGIRPTVGDLLRPILEVHLLNFSGNLYGKLVSVEFKHKVRDEKKFINIESLVDNIKNDINWVRKWFIEQNDV